MFDWSDEYSVSLPSIDAQHRNLFAIGQELFTAMSTGKGKQSCSRILERLVSYTAIHFAAEERMMRLANYPQFEAHKAEHDALTKQVVQFQEDLRGGRLILTVQLLQFLKDWLDKHIKGSDMLYAPYVKRAEPAAAPVRSRT